MFVSPGKRERTKTIFGLERDKGLVVPPPLPPSLLFVKFRERTREKTIRVALDLPAIDRQLEQAGKRCRYRAPRKLI